MSFPNFDDWKYKESRVCHKCWSRKITDTTYTEPFVYLPSYRCDDCGHEADREPKKIIGAYCKRCKTRKGVKIEWDLIDTFEYGMASARWAMYLICKNCGKILLWEEGPTDYTIEEMMMEQGVDMGGYPDDYGSS